MSSIEKAMHRKNADANSKRSSIEKAQEKQNELNATLQQDVPKPTPSGAESLSQGSTGSTKESISEPLVADKNLAAKSGQENSSRDSLYIDLDRLEQSGYVALSDKRTLINEEYRSIKRKLLSNAFGPISQTLRHSNLILVSSSKPNEGKTFTAVNLALSIALEQDKTVLLVDSDVLKPSVAKSLDIGDKEGLIEYLLGEKDSVADIIYSTNIPNLRVIPAGLPHHLSNELLSSDKMFKLIEEFATRYPDRIVIFDAPPLLGVNETSVMAQQCGQGVVVVEEHKSKLADVKKAVDILPLEMAVGFVLNKVTSQREEHGYGYYYGSSD